MHRWIEGAFAFQRHSSQELMTQCMVPHFLRSSIKLGVRAVRFDIIFMAVQFRQHWCFCTLPDGLVSIGAPKAPPAKDFLRFSLTWVSLSSRSTRSRSFIWQLSSSWAVRSSNANRCLSAPNTLLLLYILQEEIALIHRKCLEWHYVFTKNSNRKKKKKP